MHPYYFEIYRAFLKENGIALFFYLLYKEEHPNPYTENKPWFILSLFYNIRKSYWNLNEPKWAFKKLWTLSTERLLKLIQ